MHYWCNNLSINGKFFYNKTIIYDKVFDQVITYNELEKYKPPLSSRGSSSQNDKNNEVRTTKQLSRYTERESVHGPSRKNSLEASESGRVPVRKQHTIYQT